MKKIILTICLVLVLLTSGCTERAQQWQTSSTGGLTFLIPSICLIVKNIDETNAIMEAEKKADAEFGQLKNPVWFVE